MGKTVFLNAISFSGAGVESWDALAARIAKGDATLDSDWQAAPKCLAPRQARRLSPQIRLAVMAAEDIGPALGDGAAWVFASSVGEGETLNTILEALCSDEMMIQPLRFQNAVHNAASGQWTIAAKQTGPCTSIAAYDETVGAGWLKAMLQVVLEGCEVGLVCFDAPIPVPLHEKRPFAAALAAGFALAPSRSEATVARVEVETGGGQPSIPQSAIGKAMAETGNPVAAVLPILECLVAGQGGAVALALSGGSVLRLTVAPPA
ncbi:MAG: beta-ketoacyl synthase chain length factor [Pseudomonadota bacterium]